PSGGFVAKGLLLIAAVRAEQWWWAVTILIGGLLAGGYVLVVLGKAMGSSGRPLVLKTCPSRRRQLVALAVALCAVLLGLVPLRSSQLLELGRPAVGVAQR